MLEKLRILATLGPGWALFRAGYALRRKAGLLKRGLTTTPLDQIELADLLRPGVPADLVGYRDWRREHGGQFLFAPGRLPSATMLNELVGPTGRETTLHVADDYRKGRFLYYSRHVHDLGQPVDWLLNPINGGRHNNTTHWCDYPTFSRELGDIKDVWEPSRFALAFWLVRAFALTGDSTMVEDYWRLFDSWTQQNPPNMGPNWKCGQETAIRCFGMCFALYAFADHPATNDRHIADMAKLMAVSAERIEKNIDYAYSQKNNHGMSEAIGLLTVGLLFPELRYAEHWERKGRDYLEREIARQIYDDGSFVQHSMNYHRVMLHDCLWAARLAEVNGQPLSQAALSRIDAAGEFLHAMLDVSGGVPNHGANDGANVLPLTACDYTDFRPTVQAARFRATGKRVLPDGPWNEMLVWMWGADTVSSANQTPVEEMRARRFDAGGYYTLHHGDSWAMIRCHTYRDRPAHLDMLHLDLWHRGVNVLSDSGTYRYYAPDDPAAEKYFKGIAAHNTIELDGRNPLDLVSRFLWMPWPAAKCIEHSTSRFQGEHYAYNRSPWRVVHRRTVELGGPGVWIVTDELIGSGEHEIALRWHVADGKTGFLPDVRSLAVDYPKSRLLLQVHGPKGLQLTEAPRCVSDAMHLSGWESRYYMERTPRTTMAVKTRALLPFSIVTRIFLLS